MPTFRAAHVREVRGHDAAADADASACANAVVRETRISLPRRRDEAPTRYAILRGTLIRHVSACKCTSRRPRRPGREKAPLARLCDPANPCDNIALEHSAAAHASGTKLQISASVHTRQLATTVASPHPCPPPIARVLERSTPSKARPGRAGTPRDRPARTGALPPAFPSSASALGSPAAPGRRMAARASPSMLRCHDALGAWSRVATNSAGT